MYHLAYIGVYNCSGPMRTPNKHQQKTQHTRRKLLDAGLRIFARDGFEAARIEDIAAAAGHTRGAFYANFETKEDLFLALLEEQSVKRVAELHALLERCKSPDDAVKTLRARYLKRADDLRWVILALEFKLFALRHGKLRAKLAAAHRRIRASMHYDAITKFLPPRLCDAKTGEAAKVMLEVALAGLVLEQAYDPKRISREQVAHQLGQIFDMLLNQR
jgi:AcrR family transcriptional regulator